MGATATMLYGITLLLDPVPPEVYKSQPPMAEQTRRKWGPSWRKPWGKKKRKGSVLDGAGSVKDVRAAQCLPVLRILCPPQARCRFTSTSLAHTVLMQALEVESSADSFSSAASGTSVNSGTTMTSTGISGLAMLYHIRVLIPCYKVCPIGLACRYRTRFCALNTRLLNNGLLMLLRLVTQEDFEIVQKTLNAIREAALPVGACSGFWLRATLVNVCCNGLTCVVCSAGCQRTVYLLDDGKDKKKRKWASRLGADVVYVSGRHRPADESNGKSGNLNNALTQIYPDGIKIPPHEIVCIMDADQARSPAACSASSPCPFVHLLLSQARAVPHVWPQCIRNIYMSEHVVSLCPRGTRLTCVCSLTRLTDNCVELQIADPTFFMKTLPLMDDGDDIAMVLSPQCFHNVHHQADIFNHTNIHFWEYMQIGYDALSFISCTGASQLLHVSQHCLRSASLHPGTLRLCWEQRCSCLLGPCGSICEVC